jgi:hypothetical protein
MHEIISAFISKHNGLVTSSSIGVGYLQAVNQFSPAFPCKRAL